MKEYTSFAIDGLPAALCCDMSGNIFQHSMLSSDRDVSEAWLAAVNTTQHAWTYLARRALL
jgi:hypothetical protein